MACAPQFGGIINYESCNAAVLSLELLTNRQQDERGGFLCRATMPVNIYSRRTNTVNHACRGGSACASLEPFTFRMTRVQSNSHWCVCSCDQQHNWHAFNSMSGEITPFQLLFNQENYVSMTDFFQFKSVFFFLDEVWMKFNCDLQVFPLNGIKRISCNYRKRK